MIATTNFAASNSCPALEWIRYRCPEGGGSRHSRLAYSQKATVGSEETRPIIKETELCQAFSSRIEIMACGICKVPQAYISFTGLSGHPEESSDFFQVLYVKSETYSGFCRFAQKKPPHICKILLSSAVQNFVSSRVEPGPCSEALQIPAAILPLIDPEFLCLVWSALVGKQAQLLEIPAAVCVPYCSFETQDLSRI